MTENHALQAPAEPIAIVGMACRFPEATGPAEFLELVLTGRRAFRRMPPARLDVSEYGDGEPSSTGPNGVDPAVFGSVRAALLEGWRFDRAAYGVTLAAYQATDPAHWLALETAARALADGGFPGGQGLTRDRTGVIIGNTLTGEVSRATALRARWPYVRRVLRAALAAGAVSPERHAEVIEHAAAGFLAPFPEIGDDTLAGSLPGAIADRICGHFGFRGGGHAVDAAHSSSLLAIAAACSALAAGDLDAAIAGGVDISLDPFELAGLAGTGVLARGEMRVFDARPTGFLPGEGCGLTVLMRAAEARAAGVPVYAEIAGWGVSSAGNPALTRPGSASLLLALRRAYHRARVDPADVQLIEGDGTGTASGDLAELTSLAEIRQESPRLAALGSVKANIGHTKAAAGAAGLIKATLAIAAGIIPPATGCARPHPLIASEDARLRVPDVAEPWPERVRLAGVTSVGPGGASVHLILRRARDGRRRRAPGLPLLQASATGQHRAGAGATIAGLRTGGRGKAPDAQLSRGDTPARGTPVPPAAPVLAPTPPIEAFAVSGPDRQALAGELNRIAELAPWLSDGELHDLACHYGRATAGQECVRAGLVAGSQDQLAQAAREALALLPGLHRGKLATGPGIVMADRGRGRAALLFPGEGSPPPGQVHPVSGTEAGGYDPALHPAIVAASLSTLEWLSALGVAAVAGTGHGLGEITGLVWAGCLTDTDAARLVAERAALLGLPSAEPAALVCVDAGRSEAEALCAGTDLVIAAYNGPRCHVLAGPAGSVRDLTKRLAEDGVPARLLGSPLALYSRAMADLVAPMRSALRDIPFQPPARRLISTITGAEVTAADDVASLLATQLTSPVLFARALEQVTAEADLLIETGPGRQLCVVAGDCCDVPAFSLAAGRADETATAQAAAALFASGAVATLAPLFAAQLARPIDIWRERIFIPSPCGAPSPDGDPAGAGRLPGASGRPAEAGRPATQSPSASDTGPATSGRPATQGPQTTDSRPAGTGQPAPNSPSATDDQPASGDGPATEGPATIPSRPAGTGQPTPDGPLTTDTQPSAGEPTTTGTQTAASHPGTDDRPATQGRPAEAGRPATESAQTEGSQPAEAGSPATNGPSATDIQPIADGHSAAARTPTAAGPPAANDQPAPGSRPAMEGAPAACSRPAETGQPTQDGPLTTDPRPTAGDQPAATSTQITDSQPAGAGQPAVGSLPATDDRLAPGDGPTTQDLPATQSQPAGTDEPTTDSPSATDTRPATSGRPEGESAQIAGSTSATAGRPDMGGSQALGESPVTDGGHATGTGGRPVVRDGQPGHEVPAQDLSAAAGGRSAGNNPRPAAEPGAPAPGSAGKPGSGVSQEATHPVSASRSTPGSAAAGHGTTAGTAAREMAGLTGWPAAQGSPGATEPATRHGTTGPGAGTAGNGGAGRPVMGKVGPGSATGGAGSAPTGGERLAGAKPARERPARETPAREASPGHRASNPRPGGSGTGPTADPDPAGTAPWVRCFIEERRAAAPEPPGATATWQVRASGAGAYGTNEGRVFAHDTDADTVLAVLGDPAEPATCTALLGAARDAIRAGRLVVIAPGPGLTGLCASLHAEHPGMGITLIRARPGRGALEAARRFATATPGRFREVILDGAGAATEPVMVATEPAADGTFPLGPADVVLLSGITRVGDLACATSLASRGAALAVIAPPGPENPQITALLTRLRSAGIRVSRKKADLTDPGQVAAAVRSLERGLGPVTAVVHAAASGPVERCARLAEPTLRSFLSGQRGRFANVIGAVAMERVRLLVTFGSVAARYGRAGGACDALASGLLAEQAARLAEGWPRCRVLHLDWAPWAGPDQAGRPPGAPQPGQATPIGVEDGSRYLLSLLTTADMPARAAVHGRLGGSAPAPLAPGLAGTAARGRFGETVRVHYPGVELIADTRLSVPADPYLADYRLDDLPMLPAAMVLEAMAQTASALAGRELRHLADARLTAPVLLLGRDGHEEAVIRVCALRVGDTVEAVLRCAETGFRLDHARAVFRTPGRPGAAPPPAGWAAGPGRGTGSVASGAMVDGTDLYGQLFFQAGRFRRVAFLPEAGSRACRALVRGGDDLPWFGAVPGPVDAPLVLGSPGLNDATLHMLQACLPHRRVLATGCESVTFSGREVRGALRVQAVRRPPAAGDPSWAWDVVATDATGQPVVTWQGVRLRDVGPLVPPGPWHPALLAISVEARAAEFGLDPELRAVISCGAPPPGQEAGSGAAGDDQPWSDRAEGTGPLAGFELTVRASRPVACRWQAVGGLAGDTAPLDEALAAVRGQLAARLREPAAALDARLATIASALTALGRAPGTPLRVEDASDAGWIVVRAGAMAAASAVTQLSGVGAPIAVALASLLTRPGRAGPGRGGRGERLTAGGR